MYIKAPGEGEVTNYTIQEIEHENLILGQELISLYKKKIYDLEAEIVQLKSLLTQAPIPLPTQVNKRKVVTVSELREILEKRSSKVLGSIDHA